MIHLSQLAYAPRGLGAIDLVLQPGEMVMLCGPSGSGKSTLGQLILGDLEPTAGDVVWKSERSVGYLSHDAEGQLLGSTVEQELEIGGKTRVRFDVSGVSLARTRLLERFRGKELEDPQLLSAGEQQLLLLGSLVSRDLGVLILDEALSCLDGSAFAEVCRCLRLLAAEGLAVLVISHELRMVPWCHRCLGLVDGRIAFDRELEDLRWSELRAARIWLGSLVGQVGDGRVLMPLPELPPERVITNPAEQRSTLSLLSWRDRKFSMGPGRALVVSGVSGGGKSRLLATLLGFDRLAGWSSLLTKTCYRVLLPQIADSVLWRRTVAAELAASSAEGRQRNPGMVDRLAPECTLPDSWMSRSPRSLSHGQVKYLAALCLLLQAPQVLLLDEAFAGLDSELRAALLARLTTYREAGGHMVIATHHPDEMVLYSERLLVLEGGSPVWFGSGWDFFYQNPDSDIERPSLFGWKVSPHSGRDAHGGGQL